MKQFSIILLTTFYFICATGLFVHAHFCGGELSSITYSALSDHHDCGCGDEGPDEDCCKDVMHFYKVGSHQTEQVNASGQIIMPYVHLIVNTVLTILFGNSDLTLIHGSKAHSPPPFLFNKTDKFIVHRVFRI